MTDEVFTPPVTSRERYKHVFEAGPRAGEIAEYRRGDTRQQVWEGSVWHYAHEETLRMVWTEVPLNLRIINL